MRLLAEPFEGLDLALHQHYASRNDRLRLRPRVWRDRLVRLRRRQQMRREDSRHQQRHRQVLLQERPCRSIAIRQPWRLSQWLARSHLGEVQPAAVGAI